MDLGSTRPVKKIKQDDFKIWYIGCKVGDEISELTKCLKSPINDGKCALYPTMSVRGTMFFQAM
jgi:hypothetical protein